MKAIAITKILHVVVLTPRFPSAWTWCTSVDLLRIMSISCSGVKADLFECSSWPRGTTITSEPVGFVSVKIASVELGRSLGISREVAFISWQIGWVPTGGQTSVTDANDWRGTIRCKLHVRANSWLVEFPSSRISVKSAGENVLKSDWFVETGSRKAIE